MYIFMICALLVLNSTVAYGESMQKRENVIPGYYRHYRTGKLYNVIGVARYSEDPYKEFVIYEMLYDSVLKQKEPGMAEIALPHGTLWARPKDMFMELVEKDGKRVPRFEKVDAPSHNIAPCENVEALPCRPEPGESLSEFYKDLRSKPVRVNFEK